jgi:hypothetical protein
MNAWISAAVGALLGYMVLALTVLWMRNLCLPVSAHEFKWQCEAGFWAIAATYFASSFVATFFAKRGKAPAGLFAFAALFLGHAFLPDLAIISFGKRWYLNEHALLSAVIPAMAGVAVAMLAVQRRRSSSDKVDTPT